MHLPTMSATLEEEPHSSTGSKQEGLMHRAVGGVAGTGIALAGVFMYSQVKRIQTSRAKASTA